MAGKRKRNIGTELVRSISDYLELNKRRKGYCFWRNNSGAAVLQSGAFVRFGTPGSPDIIVVKDGFFIGLEIKAGSGRLSPAQKDFRDMIKANGGEYHEIRSIDDVIEIGL